MIAGLLCVPAKINLNAQTKVKADQMKSYELEVINELTTPHTLSTCLYHNCSTHRKRSALKAFFFTPVTAKTLRGKRIAVLATDGFEEIELTGPVWYFRQLGATVDIVAPKYNPRTSQIRLELS